LHLLHPLQLWYNHLVFSKIVRRTHMYLALFLAPWMVGYALSTIAMNHRMPRPTALVTEIDRPYPNVFEPGTPPREMAQQILSDLNLDGAYGVQGPAPDGRLIINRQGMLSPRRITYRPQDRRVVVERMELETSGFLNRFHRRRGYQQPYAADLAMAVSVDAVIVAMVFWALSGLWMWWEMRATRGWGLACAATGIGIFTLFVLTI
jgi:hypothetical protein